MHRFFVDYPSDGLEEILITGDDVAHISKVLRLKEDDEITVCDSLGNDCLCSVSSISKDEVRAWILSRKKSNSEPPVEVAVFQGVPKGDKLDIVVQKCVELGAVKIVPVAMKRSVALIKDKGKKKQRLQKIALEASKQSARAKVASVDEVMSFKDAVELAAKSYELKLLPYEGEEVCSIKAVLKEATNPKSICIFIGPEGGFDPAEVELARENGFSVVSMGPRIMRTETAPLAALSVVMYELGDW